MNETLPLLGFAIPAYRRPQLLSRALETVVPQARMIGAPIFVPDNACDDTNAAVLQRWRAEYERVVHYVNEENIGIDRNVDRAIARCPAKYVHVIGDDDILLPGFAERMHRLLSERQPGHVLCGYQYLTNDYRPITGRSVIPNHGNVTSLRSFLPASGWTLGFIGAHVFHRERYTAGTESGFGTYFHHLIRLIGYVDPDEPIPFLETPLVGNRADDESTPTWSGDRLAVLFGLERSMSHAMRLRYSPTEIDSMVANCRSHLGYTQFVRLVYWAALARRSGHEPAYWRSLEALVPPAEFRRVRDFPTALHGAVLRLVPIVRRMKRPAASLGGPPKAGT